MLPILVHKSRSLLPLNEKLAYAYLVLATGVEFRFNNCSYGFRFYFPLLSFETAHPLCTDLKR